MKEKVIKIKQVHSASIAEEVGIEAGDSLISVNGKRIKDVFDYRFLITEEYLQLEVEKSDGEIWDIEVEKDEYEDLGLEFDDPMLDDAKSCTNHCIFCFVDQLPKGMRNTLYFKDDDTRLSFMMGNYVTLTNMKDEDIERIIKYRMSPINVSVHTTNTELRIQMLKNKFAGNVMDRIKKLTEAGIIVNCQIVLCRGVNDGEELQKSIRDLSSLYPGVYSISVVPVGLTKHREGLFELLPFDSEASLKLIQQVELEQSKLIADKGSSIVYIADEFYIMAGIELPKYEDYEDFPQIENGVGLISMMNYEIEEALSEIKNKLDVKLNENIKRRVSIATGISSAKYIELICDKIKQRVNLEVLIYPIKNSFFGETVTVTGLITASDIMTELQNKDLGEELFISRSMLRSGEEIFLDDITLKELQEKLNIKITAVDNSGLDFVEKIANINL